MKGRRLLIAGLVLLVAGCLTSLYLGLMILGVRAGAIFGSIVHDGPSNSFPRVRCPLLLSTGERAVVGVTLVNNSDRSLSYAISIQVDGLQLVPSSTAQDTTLSPGQRASLTWQIAAPVIVSQQVSPMVIVQAVSNADAALPGPFHMWPTSYRQACGIWVVDSPIKGYQIIGLSLAGLVAGALLCLLYVFKRKNRQVKASE